MKFGNFDNLDYCSEEMSELEAIFRVKLVIAEGWRSFS
jgi:hypothetical protein